MPAPQFSAAGLSQIISPSLTRFPPKDKPIDAQAIQCHTMVKYEGGQATWLPTLLDRVLAVRNQNLGQGARLRWRADLLLAHSVPPWY